MISGEYPPSEGHVTLDGRSIGGLSADRVAALGIARSFQTSSLFPEDTVRENAILAVLAHTPERRALWRPLGEHTSAVSRAERALENMGLLAQADQPASTLSHGEARQLELAMVLRALLLDEPLAGLSAHEREHVIALVHGLPRDLTIILIEHDLPFCLTFADHITVLSNGEHLATGTPEDIRTNEQVQAVYVGSALQRQGRTVDERKTGLPAVLHVQNLSAGYGQALAVDGVSLEVHPGEVVAVLGRNGMGKTTLLTTLMGWRAPTGGTVALMGQDVTGLNPAVLSKRGLALVPQGRRVTAELTVDEELRLATRPGKRTRARIRHLPALKGATDVVLDHAIRWEQQIVAIGRALLQNPQVMLLDEPPEGLSPLMVTVVRDVLLQLRARPS